MSSLLDIPKTNSAVATAGSDGTAIAGKVKRIDILLVTGERVADLLLVDIPDLEKEKILISFSSAASYQFVLV